MGIKNNYNSKLVTLLINPVFVKVLTLDSGLLNILDDKFKYKDPKTNYSSKLQDLIARKIIDGYHHFFKADTTQKLPIGFLEELKNILTDYGYKYKIEDYRKYPNINILDDYDDLFKNIDYKQAGFEAPIKLRYYQKECFDEILKKKNFNGIIHGATGFGKTFIFLALTRMIEGNILIIFPGTDLVFQTKKVATKLGYKDVGLISGKSQILGKRIILINYQSINKLDNIKKYKTVFVDECHSAKANTIYNTLKKSPATIRLGFSGSPYSPFATDKFSNAKNKANFGEIIYEKKAKELIDEGFLAETIIHFFKIDKPRGKWYLRHNNAIDNLIVNGEYRNKIIKRIAKKDNKITLILVIRREHGEILNNLISNSQYVHGDTEKEAREKIQDIFNKGEIKIVISTVVWNTGIDIPNLERIIIAGSGKSFYQAIQRIGRGLRKTKTKNKLELYDFIDNTNYYLKDWSKKRWSIYTTEGYPIVPLKIKEIL